MDISQDVIEAARRVESEEGVAASVLLALAIVETNARAFAEIGPRREPLIRFEGHYFDRLLDLEARRQARAAGLAHPRAGAVRSPAGQAARWAMLESAARIDSAAAYQSTSWGLCQVMGAHWQRLGFVSAEALADLARSSAAGQFALAARFLKEGRLAGLLLAGDHAGFSRRYNGPAFARNRYDTKIASAYRQAIGLLGPADLLRTGDRGTAVAALQRALAVLGFPLTDDGIFGRMTEAALRAFQARSGLAADGVAGPATLGRLGLRS